MSCNEIANLCHAHARVETESVVRKLLAYMKNTNTKSTELCFVNKDGVVSQVELCTLSNARNCFTFNGVEMSLTDLICCVWSAWIRKDTLNTILTH